MLPRREILRRIAESRRAWARALAEAASRSGVVGETYRDVGDGYGVFAGESSLLSFAWGNFYPATIETLAGLYQGRDREWTAIPAQREQAVNSIVGAGGRVYDWQQVMFREVAASTVDSLPPGYTIQRSEDLEPWIEAARDWFYSGEGESRVNRWRLLSIVPGVRCYLAWRGDEVMGLASAFAHEGTAYFLDVSDRSADEEFSLSKVLYESVVRDFANEVDLAWTDADSDWTGTEEAAGFSVAYSQLVFEVPIPNPEG